MAALADEESDLCMPRVVGLRLPGPQGAVPALAMAVVPVDQITCLSELPSGHEPASLRGGDAEGDSGDIDGEKEEGSGSLDDDEEDDDDNNINNDIDKYTDNDDATIDESESSISWQERLLCVLRDGRIVAVTPDMVVAVMREGQPELGGATAAVAEHLASLPEWDFRPWGADAGGKGWAVTGTADRRAPPVAVLAPSAPSRTLGPLIPASLTAMDPAPVPSALAASVEFQKRIVDRVLRELRAVDKAGAESMPKLPPKAAKKLARANRLMRRAERIREEIEEDRARTWRSFEGSLTVLRRMGAVEHDLREGRAVATALGEVAREVRSENELWMAMALTGPAAQGLPPGALAAFVSCLTAGDVLGTKPGVRCSYAPTEQVVLAAEALEMSRVALEDAQSEAGIAGPGSTVAIDARLAGLVEAWAAGASWEQITKDTTVDDGDLARLLSRVVDVLRQVAHCRHLDPNMRATARAAVKAMVRQPISDLL